MNANQYANGERKEIENLIIAVAGRIAVDEETGCLDSETVENWFIGWRRLIEYYKDNNDFDIGIEVMREYIRVENLFGGIQHNKQADDECVEIAREAIDELNYYLNEIIKTITRKLHPGGR